MIQENILKGRIAEAIVKCMMEDLGFKIIHYGYENTCPEIANPNNVIDGEIKHIIREAPDFIIIDKNNNAHFLEVKFRANGIFKKEGIYPYQMAHLILLSSDGYIGIQQYQKLGNENKLDGSIIYGGDSKFKTIPNYYLFAGANKEIILKYCLILKKYMRHIKKYLIKNN